MRTVYFSIPRSHHTDHHKPSLLLIDGKPADCPNALHEIRDQLFREGATRAEIEAMDRGIEAAGEATLSLNLSDVAINRVFTDEESRAGSVKITPF